MEPIQAQMVFCCAEQWMSGRFYQVEPWGDGLRLDSARAATGVYCMAAVDSGENGFSWGRAAVEADLPPDTALRVYAYASDHRGWGSWSDLDQGIRSLEGDPMPVLREVFGPPVSESGDCLLGKTGRYLWVMLELTATGAGAPVVRALRLWMRGDHMVDYLPAIYQEDGFTRRFLSIFDSLYTDMDRAIDALPGEIDFDHARGDLLRYLAQWVCVEAGEGEALLRERIRTALSDYEDLYTVEGVRRSVRRLTGPGALPPAVRGGPLPLLCPAAGGRLLQPAGAPAVPAGHGGGHSRGDDHADDPAQALRPAGLAHLSGHQLPGGGLCAGGHRRAGDHSLRYHDRRSQP